MGTAKSFDIDIVSARRLLDEFFLLKLLIFLFLNWEISLRFDFTLFFECLLLMDTRLVFVEIKEIICEIL
jgi:hypothetical protein